MKLFDWLGPRGTLLVLCGFIWIQTGVGTLQGYSGSPDDAPHLLVPSLIRGTLWIISGIVAIAVAPTRSIKYHRIAITTLPLMPTVRLVSYLFSWVCSLSVFQYFFPHFPLDGSAQAEYSSIFWQADLLLVITLMLAPATWRMISNYLEQEQSGDYDRTTKTATKDGGDRD
jgi:hypothetical protein